MKFLILFSIYLSFSGLIYSQNSSSDSTMSVNLENVVIIGNKARSIPGAGQYISSSKLEKLNQTNVNNVLRTVPGINIRDEEGFGLRPNIGLRGTPVNRSAKITLMEDGILIAPAPYSDPAAYYFPTFSRMQGVEVLKGSSQIKYGPYTIGGAINLLSTAIPNSFKGYAHLSYGSYGNNQQRLWIGDSRENIEYVFEINRISSNGFKQLDNGGNTGFDRRDIMAKVRLLTDEDANIHQSLTLKFINAAEEANETYLGLTYEDFKKNPLRRYSATQNDFLDMKHNNISLTHSINPITGLSINTTAYYSTVFRDWSRVNSINGQSLNNILQDPITNQTSYLIMTGQLNGNIDYQSAARNYFSKGIQLNSQYFFNTSNVFHRIIFGFRYHIDQADRFATRSTYLMNNGKMILTSAGIKGNQENQIRNARSFATFLSYEISYDKLKLSPGFRFEKIKLAVKNYGNNDNARLGTNLISAENNLDVLLPGFGLTYDFNEYMNFFLGIHKGFSPPGMPSINSTQRQAKPETSINYEIGYRFEKNNLNFQLVGFLNNYKNILGSDNLSSGGSGTGNIYNAGRAIIKGLELNFEYILFSNNKVSEFSIPINIAYTYTDASFQETFIGGGGDWGNELINKGDKIPFISPHLLTISFSLNYKNFSSTFIARYTSTTRIKPGQGEIIVPNANVAYKYVNALKEFLILDFSSNYKFSEMFTTFLTIDNLLNNKAIVANLPQGYRPNIPFSFNIGLKVNF
ncbi:MAG: TonB-dependent receptor [Ignavibacterium sp.]|nr:TonB-dependent receptor [Ignavibacterium sp.]MCX7610038.1 TonB-dependent receptor [Ignavibacterium sp.]MDW8375046.1 TonB-dependent receptor [Ignavibacteriales bacterium]